MSERLSLLSENWFKEGLRFKCTGCGKCCTGAPGFVWVDDTEIEAIAAHLDSSKETFSKEYTRQVDNRTSLIERAGKSGFDCVFLKGKQCEIYPVRPKQCRTFPWWLHNVASEQAWRETAQECEGIDHPDAPLIPMEAILQQLQDSC